ncbi:unnamed protein product, partial [Nippostrongylus brasiliensis]|uniref:Exportin-T n=1 Tax=Nippostrongylus brasiliensis TaxID=27835 RepID=A0A0N4XQD5_NIPBR
GTLIVFGELGVEQKSVYIAELANKLGERFLAAVTELQAARSAGDSAKIQMIQQFMTNIVGYCSRLSKAFNNTNSMQSCRCVDVYMRLLNVSTDLDSMNHLLILSHQVVAKFKKGCLQSGVDFGDILASAARLSMETEPTSTLRAQDEAAYRNLIYVRRAFLQLFFTSTTSDMLGEIAAGSRLCYLLHIQKYLANIS